MSKIEGLRNLEFNIKKCNQLDSDGFLTIEGIASVADKPMEYIDWWEGKITKEIIPLDELVKSQETIVGVPITNSHPWEFINSKNATEYTKGMVIESLGIVDNGLGIKAKLLDIDLITAVLSGKDKLSTGYYCDVQEISGITDSGESYTHMQKNIRWNHLAIVYEPREDEAKITKFNSKEHNLAFSEGLKDKFIKNNDKGSGKMAVYKLNGKDFSEQEIYAEAVRLNSENATLTSERDRISGELAVEKENSKELQSKVNGIDEIIQTKVNSRIELISEVKENGIEIDGIEKMNELDIKKTVIKQNSSIDIEKKSNDYIDGIYQTLMTKLNSKDPEQTVVKENGIVRNEGITINFDSLRGGKK
ncbi:MAG: DUF2213 domain-containing protein [Cetobacterium sp.]|uniref:DUF2213 domain-containing protein n=1 Tax=Cetobacterium sp. TaxID=2071632 RepID=UPI002FCC7808